MCGLSAAYTVAFMWFHTVCDTMVCVVGISCAGLVLHGKRYVYRVYLMSSLVCQSVLLLGMGQYARYISIESILLKYRDEILQPPLRL